MGLADRWPHLHEFCRLAGEIGGVEVWLFGSALSSAMPADLDVLIRYGDRADVVALRDTQWWEDYDPPLDIIAMTPAEEHHYQFIATTGAQRLL